MKLSAGCEQDLSVLKGKTITGGQSSLNTFAISLEGDLGILLEAAGSADEPLVNLSIQNASLLPKLSEAVCAVDWDWVVGSKIVDVLSEGKRFSLKLEPAGPLMVTAAFWQGKPFLGFQPYRPAKSSK